MNRTRNLTSVKLVLLALLATVVSAGLLSAESYEGTFTLPVVTRWGAVILPPLLEHPERRVTVVFRHP